MKMTYARLEKDYLEPPEDPYTPEQIGQMKDRIYNERKADRRGWWLESITESDDFDEWYEAVDRGDHLHAGVVLDDMITSYCTPSNEECIDELDKEKL